MRKLLWVGDAGCPSGFARATHETLNVLRRAYDVTVLGMNYNGDKHAYPYDIYTCFPGGDMFGVGRLAWMCDLVKPDVIVLQNDGWNIPPYVEQLVRVDEHKHIPIVTAVAVDGKNFNGAWLKGIASAIFWTQFALDEARAGGYEGPATVIPLGVDTTTYFPMDRMESRERLGFLNIMERSTMERAYVVGNVNRNQPRKRWDLTIRYFAKWVKHYDVPDAFLCLHVAPTGDRGVEVQRLAKYYGVLDRLAVIEPPTFYGVPEEQMRHTYNSFDAQMSTTQGEGFGLTTFEGMACGVPQIVPDWSALGELCAGAATLVECTSTAIGFPWVNVIGGIPDEKQFVTALDVMYRDENFRQTMRGAGLTRVNEERFRWANVGRAFLDAIDRVLDPMNEEAWKDLGRPQEDVVA